MGPEDLPTQGRAHCGRSRVQGNETGCKSTVDKCALVVFRAGRSPVFHKHQTQWWEIRTVNRNHGTELGTCDDILNIQFVHEKASYKACVPGGRVQESSGGTGVWGGLQLA